MTVHSLVLFENGAYREISKEFDLSVHNSIVNPTTNDLVQDNYMTFFYPAHNDSEVVFDYAKACGLHLIEGWELSPLEERKRDALPPEESVLFNMSKPFPEGYKMFRIHYWTEQPIHWELNPDADLFVFNSQEIQSMVMFN
ncbi:hypothetical protein [Flavobacterium caeni]|uniref:Uncharacterized protein n=1 Tax=Flavobacterium caeni TaxID=490189 RepID=A0A1G5D0C8_9FLAO|nr:hypothetical protein [Flavobacterium caeni]SCY08173.1 hypothetical protein SAMN02927903_00702 [Flavobacterium caeni]